MIIYLILRFLFKPSLNYYLYFVMFSEKTFGIYIKSIFLPL